MGGGIYWFYPPKITPTPSNKGEGGVLGEFWILPKKYPQKDGRLGE